MTEVGLRITAADGRRENRVIRLAAPNADFVLDKERIESSIMAIMPDRHFDLLDIVAAVFAADGRVVRGGDTRRALGAGWRRKLHLTVPVADPEFWRDAGRYQKLTDCLGFLTEDDWSFSFVRRTGGSATAAFLDLDHSGSSFAADEIILFSGGLDSLAGALEVLSRTDRKVVLVTHRSAQKAIKRQVSLGQKLAEAFPKRVLHLHVRATNVGEMSRERTQRSRSFLFAGLGFVVARMFGAKTLSFYENGVVSHQLPISPQVIGSMATRTTHPKSLRLLRDLLDVVDPGWGELRNGFEWLTKAEVVRTLRGPETVHLIRHSVSCTSLREETTLHRHCGACSQCLDRRFAILAEGLDEADPAEGYATDVLFGALESDQKLTMSLDWARHGWSIAEIKDVDFLGRFGSDLSRIIDGHPTLDRAEVLRRSLDLQRRHGRAVRSVIEKMFATRVEPLLGGTLPDMSLLRRFVGERVVGELMPSKATTPTRSERGSDLILDAEDGDRREVRFFLRGQRFGVEVMGLGAIHGRPAEVAHRLLSALEEDRDSGCAPEAHRYLPPAKILLISMMPSLIPSSAAGISSLSITRRSMV